VQATAIVDPGVFNRPARLDSPAMKATVDLPMSAQAWHVDFEILDLTITGENWPDGAGGRAGLSAAASMERRTGSRATSLPRLAHSGCS
jgi:hypothetical protein